MQGIYANWIVHPTHVGPPSVAHVGPPQVQSSEHPLLALALDEFSRQLVKDQGKYARIPIDSSLGRQAPGGSTQPHIPDNATGEDLLQRYDPGIRRMLVLEQLFRLVEVSTTAPTGVHFGTTIAAVKGNTAGALWTVTCPLHVEPSILAEETKRVESANEFANGPNRPKRHRTEQLAEIVVQADSAPAFLLAVVGATTTTHPYTVECLDTAAAMVSAQLHPIKHTLKAPRPVYRNARIAPLLQTPSHYSFPSGHATYAYCAAELLASLVGANAPDPAALREALQRAAGLIADNRVVAGLHYPADSDAGRGLGYALGRWLVAQGSAVDTGPLASATYSVAKQGANWQAVLAFGESANFKFAATPRWRWLTYRAAQEWAQ